MLGTRKWHLDLTALVILGVVAFLGVALATYDPADPLPAFPFPLSLLHQHDLAVYPAHAQTANACGYWGAICADLLWNKLGLGAIYLVASLGMLGLSLLRKQEIDMPVVRTAGWMLSLIGITTLCQMLAPPTTFGPVVGPGGMLGLLGQAILETHFATMGSMILASSVTAGGLFLCTDYLLVQWLVKGIAMLSGIFVLGALWRRVRGTPVPANATTTKRKKGGISVKVSGKTLSDLETYTPEELAELEEEYEDEPAAKDEEEDEVPVTLKMSKAKEAAAAAEVKVKNVLERRKNAADRERQEVISKLNAVGDNVESNNNYELPSLELLSPTEDIDFEAQASEVRRKAKILEKTFADFGFQVKVVEIETGPVIAQYEVELEAGLRLSKITSLADDLAIALRVPSVRIVAPIPGKNTVGIEVPNEQRQTVRLREVIEDSDAKIKKMRIPLFLGKDVSGSPLVADLSTLPHLLIAGRTGTGKSVCLNAIISSILMTRKPDEVRMLMIDPKMVELSGYARLPHLMHPVVTDMRKAEAILAWAVEKMEERYALLARAGVRHISSYNQLGEEELLDRLEPENEEEKASIPRHLPFIVIVADEMADLMMTSGKEVEQHIIRLAQKSRAVGIHLILATQKPTVDVITGLIKSNLPARIAFQVASRTDSRVVLDEMGADKLLGNGDMLFLWPGTSTLLRGQGTYLSDEEINAICDVCSTGEQNFVHELMNIKVKDPEGEGKAASGGGGRKQDDMYDEAIDVVMREGRGSVSLLQRALGIGYGRAARLIDFMAEDGIVGTYNGSQAREVIISADDWAAKRESNGGGVAPVDLDDDEIEAPPKRRTRGTTATKHIPVSPPSRTIKPDERDEVNEDQIAEFEEESGEDEFERYDAESA